MRKYLLSYMSCLVMMLAGLTACSSENDASDAGGSATDKTCTLRFTLSPVQGGGSGSRAYTPGTPNSWGNGSADENMKSWVVAFMDQTSGKIDALVEKNNVPAANATQDEVVVSGLVPDGIYCVYSFANVTAEQVNIRKGQDFNSANEMYAINGNDFDIKSHAIPMSNYQDVTISSDGKKAYDNDGNELTHLWTVRMLSKITVKFKNLTNQDIKVNSITISDITENPVGDEKNIYLMPPQPGASSGNVAMEIFVPKSNWKHLPKDVSKSSFTHTITSGEGENQTQGITIPANTTDYDTSDDGANCVSFYVNESIADREYPFFVVTLDTNVGEQRYFMYTDWNQIARNDHHVLKMALSDYKMRLKVEGFSAIGMEPSLEDDGKQLNLTFHMPDDEFHIIPSVTKYGDASNTPVSFTDLKWEKLSESETGAEDKAFSTIPYLANGRVEGVMLGELGKTTGPVIYQLSCKVNAGTADELTLVYRVAISQDLSWYTNAARKYQTDKMSNKEAASSLLHNYERKYFCYE